MPKKPIDLRANKFANAVRESARQWRVPYDAASDYLRQTTTMPEWLRNRGLSAQQLENIVNLGGFLDMSPTDDDALLLKNLFDHCNLDPAKLLHWRALILALVDATFKAAGAPNVLTDGFFFELSTDVAELLRKRPQLTSNEQIATYLRRDPLFSPKYASYKITYLRKLVGKARDPKQNITAIPLREDFHQDLAERRAKQLGVPVAMTLAMINAADAVLADEAAEEFKARKS